MEWFVLMSPVPMAVEFVVTSVPALLLTYVVAVVPILLAVRTAFPLRTQRHAACESAHWNICGGLV